MLQLRRASWPYFLIPIFLLFLFFHGLPSAPSSQSDKNVPLAAPPAAADQSDVLHPGDFIDAARHRDIHSEALNAPETLLDEPDGPGTLHDLRNEKFYLGGTLSLTTEEVGAAHPKPAIFDPYPAYNSHQWSKEWKGEYKVCEGPRGTDLDRTSPEDMISVYRGNQREFPYPMFGSQEAMGVDPNVCSDRYSRYGPYGYDEDNHQTVPGFQRPRKVRWDNVNWGELQTQCYERNADRYNPHFIDQHYSRHVLTTDIPQRPVAYTEPTSPVTKSYKPRQAVVLRASSEMNWTQSHRQYLRSLIMELSLHTGMEYQVFFMVDVKDDSLPIETEDWAVKHVLDNSVPAEFRNMTVMFNERLLETWYSKVEEHVAKYQHLQPMQIFAQMYPEFDYYWQFEFDARVVGHIPASSSGSATPTFTPPGAHGTYEDFSEMVSKSMVGKDGVWGAVPVHGINPVGPKPPVASPQNDNYEWGVGEEADLITFLPIFDPRKTTWTFPNMLWNLAIETPRRSSVITQWRMSKQLLDVMHEAQMEQGLGFVSEMAGPSFALLHGLKAVHVPHPIYADGKWTPKEIAKIYNPGTPENINGEPDSVWNWNHLYDHIMYRTTYMFTTQAAEDLFRRWLGYKPDPNQYTDGSRHEDGQGRFWYDGGSLNEPAYGRLCFPHVWLHTIKNFELQKGPDMAVPV
ncbi:hypothetical protein AWENTII_009285 [Aspergillus wentii]